MIPRLQMIPKYGQQMILDRKWSPKSTANDPIKKWREWIGSYGTDYKKGLIIKRNLFPSPSREKGMEGTRSQVNLYKAKKKME